MVGPIIKKGSSNLGLIHAIEVISNQKNLVTLVKLIYQPLEDLARDQTMVWVVENIRKAVRFQ